MLREIRIVSAIICFTLITLLFLDFTGTLHHWFGWLAKIQLIPAILSVNVLLIILLFLLTLIFGRIYCSIICPLGVLQDIISWFGKKVKKNRFSYSPSLSWLRYITLGLFIICIIAGIHSIVSLLEPYSSYGRITTNLFSPLYKWGNNLLANISEHYNSYAFYGVDVWIKSTVVLGTAAITFIIIFILAFRNGRTYCNTICPVGTLLGTISKYSLFRPVIDTSKCNNCGLCAKNCKSSCIDSKSNKIDYSRCVVCLDCINKCRKNAISYSLRSKDKLNKVEKAPVIDNGKRTFLSVSAILATDAIINAQEKKVNGGLAIIKDKKSRNIKTRIVPPGAISLKNLSQHCTSCQLCVSACPNDVLKPSSSIDSFMQPIMSFEKGYCTPECNECSNVCPTGAIKPITIEEKSAIQIGHAILNTEYCIAYSQGVPCKSCEKHCITGAIHMIYSNNSNSRDILVPSIDTDKCIGCGACENLCPVKPFSAVYVTGHERHRKI